ncbi:glutathione S-transferase family protein [Labrenzia sp. VG12]|uniref:glutathione S-transferase family protein n=1 Tax=Labrenzia sp. VG12 TaxID=2021862 RepID=UPI000B8BB3EE|nr:glutathione S-transferase family protein [Labrenzia sp. VG12]ASP35093.1 hypothetical protein CHH27_19135 [Labrenzia sp. VG12]
MCTRYKIIGHRLCPYVQRVVIAMLECGIPFDRVDIELHDKPGWLEDVSPLGRVPVLQAAEDTWLFESGSIAAFVDRQSGGRLMPEDPLAYAQQDAWMRFADDMLSRVARMIYLDPDARSCAESVQVLVRHMYELERRLWPKPYFSGSRFGLLDAVLASLFRSFPVLDRVSEVKLTANLSDRQRGWWHRVKDRRSVREAVPAEFDAAYAAFIAAKDSHAGRILKRQGH